MSAMSAKVAKAANAKSWPSRRFFQPEFVMMRNGSVPVANDCRRPAGLV